MRQIEQQLLDAVNAGRTIDLGNTKVESFFYGKLLESRLSMVMTNSVLVKLHGTIIVAMGVPAREVLAFSMGGYDTNLTRSRLNVLGIPIRKVSGINTLYFPEGRYLVDPAKVYLCHRQDPLNHLISIIDCGLCPEGENEQISYFENVLSLLGG